MNRYVFYGWKGVVFALVVLVVLGSAGKAFGVTSESQDVTLSATIRNPVGSTGTMAFTFALEEMPAASAMLPNYSTIAPEPSAIPELSTLALIGLGVLGLVVLRKRWDTRRSR